MSLAREKSKEELPHLRAAAFSVWHRRWSSIIGISAQRALASSLLSLPKIFGAAEKVPSIDDVLAEGRYETEVEHHSIREGVAEDRSSHEDPYPGGGRLNTLTHDLASGGRGA